MANDDNEPKGEQHDAGSDDLDIDELPEEFLEAISGGTTGRASGIVQVYPGVEY